MAEEFVGLLNKTITDAIATSQKNGANEQKPNVFDYLDYRSFFRDMYEYLKKKNYRFSRSALVQRAGLGINSRGYFRMIVEGKRNLSEFSIIGFGRAFQLSEKEIQYLENLVFFNQAKSEKDKLYYLGRLKNLARGGKTIKAVEVLQSQYRYLSTWYLAAIRELISLPEFTNDPNWIVKKLKGSVTKDQVTEAIKDLITLGMIEKDETGHLKVIHDVVTFKDNPQNFQVANTLHREMMELAKNALEHEPYQWRSCSSIILACKASEFESMREEIKEFRRHLLSKYGQNSAENDSVVGMGFQLFFITDQNKIKENK
ncbi:MAG: TIGR02147 family protein [Bdellovibrionaceae bacterium]|nr:TIGR02147 family protein [Pseudobdellovibrionaceae bacterium]MDW8191014.1 TIGR02147 family protein [Pseudobdellovibrionaceae bacterium]